MAKWIEIDVDGNDGNRNKRRDDVIQFSNE